MRVLLALLLVFSLYGCNGTEAQSPAADEAEEPTPDTTTVSDTTASQVEASLWNAQGFEVQPRVQNYRERIPPEMGFEPGTTPWREASLELPVEFTEASATSPGALLALLSAEVAADGLGEELWEQTLRVWQGGPGRATGVLLQWGLRDDAVVGHDLRVRMDRGDDGWYVEQVEERFHCARGVTEDGLCL